MPLDWTDHPHVSSGRLLLTLSQQHSKQSDPKIRQSLMGNIGTSVIFRLGLEDAGYYSQYLQFPRERDLLNLPNHRAYCRLMIDGVQSKTFSMETISPQLSN